MVYIFIIEPNLCLFYVPCAVMSALFNGCTINCLSLQVSGSKALQWCEEIGAEYFEGSAKDDLDVEKPFLRAAQSGLQQVIQSGFFFFFLSL